MTSYIVSLIKNKHKPFQNKMLSYGYWDKWSDKFLTKNNLGKEVQQIVNLYIFDMLSQKDK